MQLYSLLPTLKYVLRFDVDDTDIKRIEISSLLVDGYDKFKKVANHAEEI